MSIETLLPRNYPTSQIVTAIILKQMWESCRSNRETFAEFKSKYTDEYIDDQLDAIDAAMALPSEEARALTHIRLHNEVLALAKEGRKNWQSLKLYLSEYATDLTDELNAAGWQDYEPASNNNLPSVKSLLLKGSQYIADNTADLTTKGFMPAGFPAAYNLKMTAVANKIEDFYASVSASRIATSVKVDAFAKCYSAGISMGTDGQHLFSNNEEMRKLFSYEAVTNIVEPPGAASLVPEVLVDGLPKQGAEVSIVGTSKSGVTNVNGETLLTQLQDGPAVCKIVCDGFQDQLINITLSAGVTSRIKVTLVPLFSGEMNVGSDAASPQPAVGSPQ